MLNENGYTSGYFSLSVALHGLAVLGIILMPQLELLDEGSGHAIEFVAMEAPKGEQLDTPVVAEKEVVVKKPKKTPAAKKEVKTAEAPLPSLEDLKPKNDPPPMPENLDSEISDEEPPKPEIATALPDKEEVSLPEPTPEEPVEDTKVDDFLAEESDAITEEAQTAALAIATVEETPAVEEPQPVAEEPKPAIEEEKPVVAAAPVEDPFAEEEAEALAAANVNDAAAEKPVAAKAKTPDANKGSGNTTQAPAVAQNQSNKDYGKPTGKVRSYLDLSQVQGNRPPKYPTLARRLNQQGQVKLAYFVKSDGTIGQMKLVKSSGSQLLDKEAIRAVSKYRYKPGQAGWTLHPVNFTLQGPTKKMPSRLRTSRRGGS